MIYDHSCFVLTVETKMFTSEMVLTRTNLERVSMCDSDVAYYGMIGYYITLPLLERLPNSWCMCRHLFHMGLYAIHMVPVVQK